MSSSIGWILVDDDAQALGSLALAAHERAVVVKMVWVHTASELDKGLAAVADSRAIEVKQANTQQMLAEQIDCYNGAHNCSIVTDLNMDRVALLATERGQGWYATENPVVKALQSFSDKRCGRFVFLHHSGAGNAERIAKQIDQNKGAIFALGTSFEEDKTIAKGRHVAAEIQSKLKDLGLTPMERLWNNESTHVWFYRGVVQHDFQSIDGLDSARYRETIRTALGIGNIPDAWFTPAFHESLKHVAGAYFCGSEAKNGITPYKRLTLGAIVIIAMLAYYEASEGDIPLAMRFWETATLSFAKESFVLKHNDKNMTRAVVVALYWAFYHLFTVEEKHSSGRLQELSGTENGLQLKFNWSTVALAKSAARILALSAANRASNGYEDAEHLPPGRSSSSQALASAMTLLRDALVQIDFATDGLLTINIKT